MMNKYWLQSIVGGVVIGTGAAIAAPAEALTLSGFATFGSQMSGMEVTVNYVGGGSQTAIWQATSPLAGGAFGTGWSLSLAEDSFSTPWQFLTQTGSTQAIASLMINAVPGNTVFDTIFGVEGTPGSANGSPFTVVSGNAPTSFAYSTAIVGAEDDLRGVLTLNWSAGFSGELLFETDTDNGTNIEPVQAAVPEPTTIAGLGLAAAGLLRWRRRARYPQ